MSKFEGLVKKIMTWDEVRLLSNIWRFQDKKIVFTNGCFDILHKGHIDYLAKAADLGMILIIGLNTDKSIQILKGKNRPVQDEQSRAHILASLSFVDAVVLFDEETPFELIQHLRPDILVKGSDYAVEDIVGYDVLKGYGGEIKTLDFVEGYSTSAIIAKISNE
jgi:D-glycero-beta-D-manno-heptose 1-phosphate adenylyltransferase